MAKVKHKRTSQRATASNQRSASFPASDDALSSYTSSSRLTWAWRGALALFVLAGLTGAFFRFGLSRGWTLGLSLGNVRHAHSHLMYFGWATPALFALLSRRLPALTGRSLPRGLPAILGVCLGAALLSYPFFLLFGYTPVTLGDAHLPPSVIVAGLNMLVWYAFVVFYVRATRGVDRSRALLLTDAALTFLVFASLGAWGLSLLQPFGISDPVWPAALTHLFLDLFSEGWFVLAVLALGYAGLRPKTRGGHWSVVLLCAGLPVTFALGMPSSLVPPGLRLLASLGGVLVTVGLLANAWILGTAAYRQRRWLWLVPLALLAVKALGQLVVSGVPDVSWAGLHTLRILYLHVMLLGFVTLGLVAGATDAWGRDATRRRTWMIGAVLAVLLVLVPLTPLWPTAWRGAWALETAAWVSLLPAAVALGMLLPFGRTSTSA